MTKSLKGRSIVSLVLFGLLWLLPLGTAAQVEEARVRIDGMV